MAFILKRAAKYKRVPYNSIMAHERDAYIPQPKLLRPPPKRSTLLPDDITDFPQYKNVPIPQTIPYPQGKYRPPSYPIINGWYPSNNYLHQGKIYLWCACGLGFGNGNGWCDGLCNENVTRCRPIAFNVSESGYYKICNCKHSSNAPFCNGTHRDLIKFHHSTNRGFSDMWGWVIYFGGFLYIWWNFYT